MDRPGSDVIDPELVAQITQQVTQQVLAVYSKKRPHSESQAVVKTAETLPNQGETPTPVPADDASIRTELKRIRGEVEARNTVPVQVALPAQVDAPKLVPVDAPTATAKPSTRFSDSPALAETEKHHAKKIQLKHIRDSTKSRTREDPKEKVSKPDISTSSIKKKDELQEKTIRLYYSLIRAGVLEFEHTLPIIQEKCDGFERVNLQKDIFKTSLQNLRSDLDHLETANKLRWRFVDELTVIFSKLLTVIAELADNRNVKPEYDAQKKLELLKYNMSIDKTTARPFIVFVDLFQHLDPHTELTLRDVEKVMASLRLVIAEVDTIMNCPTHFIKRGAAPVKKATTITITPTALYRTKMCRYWTKDGFCEGQSQGTCTYAHGPQELRPMF